MFCAGQMVLIRHPGTPGTYEVALISRVDYHNSVIHFAGLKAVGESVERPLYYYRENVDGLLSLLEAMESVGCEVLVFSSSEVMEGSRCRRPSSRALPGMCWWWIQRRPWLAISSSRAMNSRTSSG